MRAAQWFRVLAVTALSVASLGAGLVPERAQAQLEPAPTEPQLFDLDLAQSELDALEQEILRIQTEIAELLDGIDGLTVERDNLDLNSTARADRLLQARTDARQMAVAAYVGVGPPLSAFELMDAATVSDLAWEQALVRQQADRLTIAAETYAVLAGEADANVVTLTGEISDLTRQLEGLGRELTRVTDQVPQAEFFVRIAEIHREADLAFEDSGRSEPTAEQWRELRFCESTETYAVDTGNTFYGAYQFTWDTWGTVGGDGNPAHAHPAEQDARARLLYARRGDQPWPICGRFLR